MSCDWKGIRDAVDKSISDKKLKEFFDTAKELRDSDFAKFTQFMKDKMEAREFDLAKKCQSLAQDKLVNMDLMAKRLQPAYKDDPIGFLKDIPNGGGKRNAWGNRVGGRAWAESISTDVLKPFENNLKKDGVLEKFLTGEMDSDIRRAIRDPMATINTSAQLVAKHIKTAMDLLHEHSVNAGYPMGYQEHYTGAQYHDSQLVNAAGFKTWSVEADKAGDWDKILGNTVPDGKIEQQKASFLKSMFQSIKEGTMGKGGTDSLDRKFFFKDADAESSYTSQFSKGSIAENIKGTIDRESRRISALKTFGSDPQANYEQMVDREISKARASGDTDLADKIKGLKPKLMGGFDRSFGLKDQVGTQIGAKLLDAGQKINNFKLGVFTTLKKFNEYFNSSMEVASSQGTNIFKASTDLFGQYMKLQFDKNYFDNVSSKLLIHHMDDSMSELYLDKYGNTRDTPGDLTRDKSISQRFSNGLDSVNNVLDKGNQALMKTSGINRQTRMASVSTAATTARFLALNDGKAFGDLNLRTQGLLSHYALGKPEWEVMKEAIGTFDHDGANAKDLHNSDAPKAVITENISQIDKAKAQSIMDQHGVKGSVDKFLKDTQLKYTMLLNDAGDTAVYRPNIRAQMDLGGTLNPNDPVHAPVLSMMQFKKVAYMMLDNMDRILKTAPELPANPNLAQSLTGSSMTKYVVPGVAASYAYGAVRDYLQRKITGMEPRDYTSPKTYLELLAQAGPLGLYADGVAAATNGGERLIKWVGGLPAQVGYDAGDIGRDLGKGQFRNAAHDVIKHGSEYLPGLAKSGFDNLLAPYIHNAIDIGSDAPETYVER